MSRQSIAVPAVVLAAALAAASALSVGCGLRTPPSRTPVTFDPHDTTTTAVPLVTGQQVCAKVTAQDFADAGIAGQPSEGEDATALYPLRTTGDTGTCKWRISQGASTFLFYVSVARGIERLDYERVVAEPNTDPPKQVPGLGEEAVYVTAPPFTRATTQTAFVVARRKGTLVKVETYDTDGVSEDQLVRLTGETLAHFG